MLSIPGDFQLCAFFSDHSTSNSVISAHVFFCCIFHPCHFLCNSFCFLVMFLKEISYLYFSFTCNLTKYLSLVLFSIVDLHVFECVSFTWCLFFYLLLLLMNTSLNRDTCGLTSSGINICGDLYSLIVLWCFSWLWFQESFSIMCVSWGICLMISTMASCILFLFSVK